MSRDLRKALAQHRQQDLHGHRLAPYSHDIVYGGNDGIVTTFAVVAGTVGADLPLPIIVVLGFANLVSDGSSMATGAYLSLKSELDNYRRLYKEEAEEIDADPAVEREEVREAFAERGLEGKDLESLVTVITRNKRLWVETMMVTEHGMTQEASANPMLHGFMTFCAFIAFGAIPLIPYVFGVPDGLRFRVAIFSTFASLAILGLTRSWVTRERLIRGPIEIVGVGAIGALVAYGIGALFKNVIGIAL